MFPKCRAALHLQLTTELVTAASGTGPEAAPMSMWQHAGAFALQHSAEWSSELLAALAACKADPLPGDACTASVGADYDPSHALMCMSSRAVVVMQLMTAWGQSQCLQIYPASLDRALSVAFPLPNPLAEKVVYPISHLCTAAYDSCMDTYAQYLSACPFQAYIVRLAYSCALILRCLHGGFHIRIQLLCRHSGGREGRAGEAAEEEEGQGNAAHQRCSCMQPARAGARCTERRAVHAGSMHRLSAPGSWLASSGWRC